MNEAGMKMEEETIMSWVERKETFEALFGHLTIKERVEFSECGLVPYADSQCANMEISVEEWERPLSCDSILTEDMSAFEDQSSSSCSSEKEPTFSGDSTNKIDWKHTDWQRPDRVYAQARKCSELEWDKVVRKAKVVNCRRERNNRPFQAGFSGWTIVPRTNPGVKRDRRGNEIFNEGDWILDSPDSPGSEVPEQYLKIVRQ